MKGTKVQKYVTVRSNAGEHRNITWHKNTTKTPAKQFQSQSQLRETDLLANHNLVSNAAMPIRKKKDSQDKLIKEQVQATYFKIEKPEKADLKA